MDESWNISRRWEDVQLSSTSDEPLNYSLSSSGIECDLEYRAMGNDEVWVIHIAPEEAFASGCAILVDLLFTLDERDFRVERELCDHRIEILQVRRTFTQNATFALCFRVIDLYTIHDLSFESYHRNFELICEDGSIFVDTAYLSSLGGTLFAEWDEMNRNGQDELFVTDVYIPLTHLECLIDATSKYGAIVVTSDNYETLLNIASKYKITAVLRKIESCLMEMKSVDPIRKLELAAIHHLAPLGDAVARKLRSSGEAIQALHRYMAETGDTLEEMHPDVLLSLGIHPKYVVE